MALAEAPHKLMFQTTRIIQALSLKGHIFDMGKKSGWRFLLLYVFTPWFNTCAQQDRIIWS